MNRKSNRPERANPTKPLCGVIFYLALSIVGCGEATNRPEATSDGRAEACATAIVVDGKGQTKAAPDRAECPDTQVLVLDNPEQDAKGEQPATNDPAKAVVELRVVNGTRIQGLDPAGKPIFERDFAPARVTAFDLDNDETPPVTVALREGKTNRVAFLTQVGEFVRSFPLDQCLDTVGVTGIPESAREEVKSLQRLRASSYMILVSRIGAGAFSHACAMQGEQPVAGILLPGSASILSTPLAGSTFDLLGVTQAGRDLFIFRVGLTVEGRLQLRWATWLGMNPPVQIVIHDPNAAEIAGFDFRSSALIALDSGKVSESHGLKEKPEATTPPALFNWPRAQSEQSAVSGQPPAQDKKADDGSSEKEQDEPEAPDEQSEKDAKEGVFFMDDLNSGKYVEGDPVREWGEKVYALREKTSGKLYLGFQDNLAHTLERKISFPENWVFEFTIIVSEGEYTIVFEDEKGEVFTINARKGLRDWLIQLPGQTGQYVGTKGTDRFRVVRNGPLWKVYVDGQFIISVEQGIPLMKSFRLAIPTGVACFYAGDFSGTIPQ